ncbi:MAG TPA: BamA/TamA family outer membrane protein [Candidatus Binataceae bacterium]|nr:BamA/TamA family outer membrane protein [Candidatus Binataceae bacterium]
MRFFAVTVVLATVLTLTGLGRVRANDSTNPPAAFGSPSASATPGAGAPAAASGPPSAPAAAPTPAGAFSLLDPTSWPVIPVPEVATDPNSGTFVGLLAVFLQNDGKGNIKDIIAPDVNWNTTLGAGGNFRYLAYPSADTQWFVIGGASQRKYAHFEGDWATGITRQGHWSFETHFLFEHDPTERFFGLGDSSAFGAQTNYMTEQVYGEGLVAYNFTSDLDLALDLRPRIVRIAHGAFNYPFTGKVFPTLKGLNGGSEFRTRLFMNYDTRDSVSIPRHGGLITLFAGVADRAFMSSASYNEFGGEIRHYFPISKRITIAAHLYTRYIPGGSETPFWAMSWLGGDGSGEGSLLSIPVSKQITWRGYGAGRYIDNNILAGNVEMRTRVYEADLFQTHGILELAPFVDVGQVFHSASEVPLDHLHPATGLGFRGIAEPFVVGFVDVGYGGNGAAIFSGINYPF